MKKEFFGFTLKGVSSLVLIITAFSNQSALSMKEDNDFRTEIIFNNITVGGQKIKNKDEKNNILLKSRLDIKVKDSFDSYDQAPIIIPPLRVSYEKSTHLKDNLCEEGRWSMVDSYYATWRSTFTWTLKNGDEQYRSEVITLQSIAQKKVDEIKKEKFSHLVININIDLPKTWSQYNKGTMPMNVSSDVYINRKI